MHQFALKLLLPILGITMASQAFAQTSDTRDGAWPSRPITVVVPFPPGGSSDRVGRLIGDRLRAVLKANVLVDNKPGGTTQLGTDLVARAAPDGHTLLVGATSAFTILPNMRKVPYDPKNGFEFLGGIADYLPVVAVRNDLGVNSLEELVKLAKQSPGKLSYGSAGIASVGHIAGEIIKRNLKIDMLHVPYKGSADAVTALVAGQIDVVIDAAAIPFIKSSRIKGIASFGDIPHPELPALPAITKVYKDVVKLPVNSGWGLFAPKGTPPAVMARLSNALELIMAEQETQTTFERIHIIPRWTTPAELRKSLETDFEFYRVLLPQIGIKNEG